MATIMNLNVSKETIDSNKLLKNPNLIVLNSKGKTILHNIKVNFDTSLISTISSSIVPGVTICGISTGMVSYTPATTSDGSILTDAEGNTIQVIDA